MAESDIPIGERIRFYRKGRTQVVIAGLAGITERYLSMVEQGRKTPSIATLHRIAQALGVSVSVLLGTPEISQPGTIHPVAGRIQAALMGYAPQPLEPTPLPVLRRRVNAAWGAWQGAKHRFTELAPVIPELTVDVQHARANAGGDEVREAASIAADLYFLLRTFTKRIGRPDLSLLVADRALLAAQEADDPLRIAAARWNLAQILNGDGENEGARDIARLGVDQLRALPPSLDALALEGALWLIAAIATQRAGDTWTARDILRTHAAEAAAGTGETNALWTVFGPTNLALHMLSVEAGAGDAAEALRIADRIDVSRSPSLERRTTFYLETASCYDQRRDDPGVMLHLLSAEDTGPEDLRYNPIARDLVRSLHKRARPSMRGQIDGLASRIGLLEA